MIDTRFVVDCAPQTTDFCISKRLFRILVKKWEKYANVHIRIRDKARYLFPFCLSTPSAATHDGDARYGA